MFSWHFWHTQEDLWQDLPSWNIWSDYFMESGLIISLCAIEQMLSNTITRTEFLPKWTAGSFSTEILDIPRSLFKALETGGQWKDFNCHYKIRQRYFAVLKVFKRRCSWDDAQFVEAEVGRDWTWSLGPGPEVTCLLLWLLDVSFDSDLCEGF